MSIDLEGLRVGDKMIYKANSEKYYWWTIGTHYEIVKDSDGDIGVYSDDGDFYPIDHELKGSSYLTNDQKLVPITITVTEIEPKSEWVDGMPPVGAVCELWVGGVFDDVVEFIGLRNEYTAVFWRLNRDVPDAGELPTVDFRPLQTEREKAIEAAVDVIQNSYGENIIQDFITDNDRRLMGALYDAGLLKAPSGD
jgi:hypothetical protein